jgi:hypothetical protein
MSTVTATSFEREAIEASNLYTTALNIKDKAAPDSLSKVVTEQHLNLEDEKKVLTEELKKIRGEAQAYERDFLDQRAEKGEVIAPITTAGTLQDGVLSFFLLSFFLFWIVLIYFSFIPPYGNTQSGIKMIIGFLITSAVTWALIYNYA